MIMQAGETEIEVLLDLAHSAAISAQFATLAGLAPQLEQALARFDPQRDAALLDRVRRKAARNAACLLAAGRGVRAAVRRIEEVRRAASGLVTYDGRGKRAVSGSTGTLSQRF
jgi:hypothetical protein